VGIILGDVLYFFTDSLAAFLLFIPGAFVGYWLARRFMRKWGSFEGYLKGGK
jgi:positive regulator of sigma E activity